MKSTTAGRDPVRAFSREAFEGANNKIRLDLAYASNGAVFGAESVNQLTANTFSVDRTLRTLLNEGENLAPLSIEEASKVIEGNGIEFWNRWNRIFAPKKAYESVLKGNKKP
jgi:hypothetical protein